MTANQAYAKEAAAAHANLNSYHAVITLCEGGLFLGHQTHNPVQRIIAICKDEARRELIKFDAALEKLKATP